MKSDSRALALVAPELERLMRLGLAGRLEVELRLLRTLPERHHHPFAVQLLHRGAW